MCSARSRMRCVSAWALPSSSLRVIAALTLWNQRIRQKWKTVFLLPCILVVAICSLLAKPVTLKKPARAGVVQCPSLHTNPAKFVAALATRHVVTAFVFLDGCRALGTTLRVCGDPQCVRHFLRVTLRLASF